MTDKLLKKIDIHEYLYKGYPPRITQFTPMDVFSNWGNIGELRCENP